MHYNQFLVLVSYYVNVFIISYDIVDSKNVWAHVMDLYQDVSGTMTIKKHIWIIVFGVELNEEKRFLGATNQKRFDQWKL